jgi:hypothetical protein
MGRVLLACLAVLLLCAQHASGRAVLQPENCARESFAISYWNYDASGLDFTGENCPFSYDLASDVCDGPNLYAYVQQNPWTGFDPHGLAWTSASGNHTTDLIVPRNEEERRDYQVAAIIAGGIIAAPIIGVSAPAVVSAASVPASQVATAYVSNPAAWNAAITAGVTGAVVYNETGNPAQALKAMAFSGLMSYADGSFNGSPKPGKSGPAPQPRSPTDTAKNVQAAQPKGIAQDKSTTAAMQVEHPDGTTSTLVSSSRARLTPEQRNALAPGEQEVPGRPGDHAEIKLFNEALKQGLKPLQIDPSRPFCPDCERVRQTLDVPTSTPARPPKTIEKEPTPSQ